MKTSRTKIARRRFVAAHAWPLAAAALGLGAVASAGGSGIRSSFEPAFAEERMRTGRYAERHPVWPAVTPPRIDGRLDDEAWKKAEPLVIGGNGKAETIVRICYDADHLYFAFESVELPGRQTQAEVRDRNGPVWEDDAIEILLGPPQLAKTRIGFHFIINAAGSVFDRRIRFGNTFGGPYNPDFEHAVRVEDDRWFVEVALPVGALEIPGWPALMGVSLGRDGPGLGASFWSVRRDFEAAALEFKGLDDPQEAEADVQRLEGNQPAVGHAIQVSADRAHARPGERWIRLDCEVTPSSGGRLEELRLQARLYPFGETEPIARYAVVPTRGRGRFEVDLRRYGLEKAELTIEVWEGERRAGIARTVLSAEPSAETLAAGSRIPLILDVPDDIEGPLSVPVTFGVPFPAGALWDVDRVQLVDGQGNPLPHQKEVTALWAPDGAIKWVRFDARVNPDGACAIEVLGQHDAVMPPDPVLRVVESENAVEVDTGTAVYVLGKGGSPIREIHAGGRRVAWAEGGRGLYVVDQKGRTASASAQDQEMRIESRGPTAASIRFEGWYITPAGDKLARHITRVECFAGEAAARVTHTLVLTEDTYDLWFTEVGWEMGVAPGADPVAQFGLSRTEPESRLVIALDPGESAHMIQEDHFYFNQHENRFVVRAARSEGSAGEVLHEGKECGDYAAALGREGGLQILCRDAARQHPKEFEVFPDRIVMKLFSSRAGQALDFRTETLIEKWNLDEWYRHAPGDFRWIHRKSPVEVLEGYRTNAAGWAKTHDLKFQPVASADDEALLRAARLVHRPVMVHADPEWIYRTRALGPNYPRNTDRFPGVERTVDAYLAWLMQASERWGEFGFIDYYGGPRFNYRESDGRLWPDMRRFNMTYALRTNLWLLYARSADRRVREFAARSARSHMDYQIGHWNTRTSRRGALRGGGRRELPFDWDGGAFLQNGQTGCLDTLLLLYYVTGCRRAGDVVGDFAEMAKRIWNPARLMHPTYPPFTLLRLVQAYAFDWDPDLGDLCAASMDLLEDPDALMRVNPHAAWRGDTLYKVADSMRAFFEGWHRIGHTRYLRVARAFAEHAYGSRMISQANGYVPTLGWAGAFLYDEVEASPGIAENMVLHAAHAAHFTDQETGALKDPLAFSTSAATNFLGRIGFALHVVAQEDADLDSRASWMVFDDAGGQGAICIRKPEEDVVTLRYLTPGRAPPVFESVSPPHGQAQAAYRIVSRPGYGEILLPTDLGGFTYRLDFDASGLHAVFADRRMPLVAYTPGFWYPEPVAYPPVRYFFRLPENSGDAQIFFEGTTRLYQPDGTVFGGGPVSGWIDLPESKPGLWVFEAIEPKLVRARNFPPFFAARDPHSHFIPDIEWEREPKAEPIEPIAPGTEFVPGVGTDEESQAVYLGTEGVRSFVVPIPEHDAEEGEDPLRGNGTVEFFIKPMAWSSLGEDMNLPLVAGLFEDDEGYFRAYHTVRGREKMMNVHLDSQFRNSELDHGTTRIRSHRPHSYFEQGRWTHVALVWGHRDDAQFRPARGAPQFGHEVQSVRIYIDGRYLPSNANRNSGENSRIAGDLTAIRFFPQGHALDRLRISDIQRYTDDFDPPARDRAWMPDRHTRALYRFRGTLDPEQGDYGGSSTRGPP